MQGDHLKSKFPTYSFKCWYGISAETAGTAFKKLQAPTYIALIKHRRKEEVTGKERCQQKPHRSQELRAHMRQSARDLFTSTLHNVTFTPTCSRN